MKGILITSFAAYFLAASSISGFASPLEDPLIPDGETASYRIRQEEETWIFTERAHQASVEGDGIYRFEYEAPSERSTVLVFRDGMLPYSVATATNGGDLSVETTTTIEFGTGAGEYEDIMLLSFSELKYLLRGYPFSEAPLLGVDFLSAGEDDDDGGVEFRIDVRYLGVESVEVAGRKIDSHRLELKLAASGIMRVMNALVPKTFYWYSVEAPHYLVAYEGSSSFPGSPKRFIEIVDYSGW
jgi:hypothetical protein